MQCCFDSAVGNDCSINCCFKTRAGPSLDTLSRSHTNLFVDVEDYNYLLSSVCMTFESRIG